MNELFRLLNNVFVFCVAFAAGRAVRSFVLDRVKQGDTERG